MFFSTFFSKAKAATAILLGCFVLSSVSAFAQGNLTVTGTVREASGEPVVGAGVLVAGTPSGAVTDIDGQYRITGVRPDAVITVTAIGYITLEEPVRGRTSIDFVLENDILALDDAVVIGYGTQRKGDITSAVASVKSEDFLAGNIHDASEMIRGKVAGLNITKSSGDPNAGSTIRLRGVTTINGDLTPLILVDGVPGDMGTVAPENIADISVLKDASAAAIYGTRGANGVILITTKTGRREENVTVNYSGYVSTSHFGKKADFMDWKNIVAVPKQTALSDDGYSTDWLGKITRPGFTHNNSLSISGGTKSTTFSANVAYRGEQGVILSTDSNDLKMSFDLTQYLLKDIVKLNLNMVKGLHKNSNSNPSYAYRQALIRNPTSPVYVDNDPAKGYVEEFGRFQYYNPVSILKEQTGDTQSEWTNLTGNITVEPVKGWQTNLMLSTHRSNSMSENYYSSLYYSNYTNWYYDHSKKAQYNGSASKSQYNGREDYLELTSKYEHNWDKHRFSGMVGYSYNYNVYEGFGASNSAFSSEKFLYNNLGNGRYAEILDGNLRKYGSMSSYKNDNRLIGFFGRISYGYDNRYNVLVSFRREGSSKFGRDHKWGNFPSVSLGWNIMNESFMSGTRDWLSNLKFRVGWGITGIIPGSSYASLIAYEYAGKFYNPNTNNWEYALRASQNPNPDLSWETSSEINVGVDFGLWNGRLYGSVDVYDKTTTGLLYWYDVPLPPNKYNSTLANVGVMNNKGVEVMIGGIPVRTRDFEWNTIVTLSHNANKLVSLSNDLYETSDWMNTGGISDPVSVSTHRVVVGEATGRFWGLKSIHGISSNGKWIVELPDGTWAESSTELNDDQYRQWLGSGVPSVIFNWGNTFRYKGFDLGVQLSGQLGFKILNNQRLFYQNNSIQYNRLKIAANELPIYNLETHQPTGEYGKLGTGQTQVFISEFLEDGDYLKLDNVTLGYTFKTKAGALVKNARLYLSGNNLFCLTKYSGLDPEIENGNPFWGAGIDDRDKYPTIRSITFGVNLTF